MYVNSFIGVDFGFSDNLFESFWRSWATSIGFSGLLMVSFNIDNLI